MFLLKVEASPCQFRVYDENEDGVVTLEEVNDLFPEDVAEKLFMKLDTTGIRKTGIQDFFVDFRFSLVWFGVFRLRQHFEGYVDWSSWPTHNFPR